MSLRTVLRSSPVFLLSTALGFGLSSWQSPGPVYSSEQADHGRSTYSARCASCHTADLGGRDDAPALAGDTFLASWKSRNTTELFEFIRDTMPPEGPPLAPPDALSIVAHILRENGAAPGAQPLTPTTAVTIGSVATGKKPLAADSRRDPQDVLAQPSHAICDSLEFTTC